MQLEYWLQAFQFLETPGTLTFITKNIYIILCNNIICQSLLVEKIVLFCENSYPTPPKVLWFGLFIPPQGAIKVSFTACHSGKLQLACSSSRGIQTSPPKILMSRIDYRSPLILIPEKTFTCLMHGLYRIWGGKSRTFQGLR